MMVFLLDKLTGLLYTFPLSLMVIWMFKYIDIGCMSNAETKKIVEIQGVTIKIGDHFRPIRQFSLYYSDLIINMQKGLQLGLLHK